MLQSNLTKWLRRLPVIGMIWLLMPTLEPSFALPPHQSAHHQSAVSPPMSVVKAGVEAFTFLKANKRQSFVSQKVFVVSSDDTPRSNTASTYHPQVSLPEDPGLRCVSVQLANARVSLPCLNGSAVLTLQNTTTFPIVIQKATLKISIADDQSKDGQRDVTRQIYVEAAVTNPQIVSPRQDAQLTFLLQFFHDAPVGALRIQPSIVWLRQPPDLHSATLDTSSAGTLQKTAPINEVISSQVGQGRNSIQPNQPPDKPHLLETISSDTQPIINVTGAQVPSSSPIVFLGDDWPETEKGDDWLGRYGSASFILCAMQSPQDIVGGRFLPCEQWEDRTDGFTPTTPVWTDWSGEFDYKVYTGDNDVEKLRHWAAYWRETLNDSRALSNPLEGKHRYASWDDHGEIRPFDGKGPDLVVDMNVPPGLFRLTLYFIDWDWYSRDHPRAHRLFFYDGNQKPQGTNFLSSGYVSHFGPGVYKTYGVQGPTKLHLRIQKDWSVDAVLSGIFLDEVKLDETSRSNPPPVAARSSALQQIMQRYEHLRTLSLKDPKLFLRSGIQTQKLLDDARELSTGEDSEARVAEWIRWQCSSSLVVAPRTRTETFSHYIALNPPSNISAARERVQVLLKNGEMGLAEIAFDPWLKLAVQADDPAVEWNTYKEAIRWFCRRDSNFAAQLSERFAEAAKAKGAGSNIVYDFADAMNAHAYTDVQGPLHSGIAYRTVVALNQAFEKNFSGQKLSDQNCFRIAEASALCPGYKMSNKDLALARLQDYLQKWPQGKFVPQATWEVAYLAKELAQDQPENANQYATVATTAATVLLKLAVTHPNAKPIYPVLYMPPSYPIEANMTLFATSAARQVSAIYAQLKQSEKAQYWATIGHLSKVMAKP